MAGLGENDASRDPVIFLGTKGFTAFKEVNDEQKTCPVCYLHKFLPP